ncbi:MAG: hemolysin family protein [Lachnospiraceae bacterium]|nr:hemolysin family protein [Lachnospiraceae bacterium]
MSSDQIIKLTIIIILILLSAFFSSAETALSTISEVKVRAWLEENKKGAGIVKACLDRYSKMLSAILIGNNIVNIAASSLVTLFVMELWGNAAISIGTGILTIVVLLFGEIVPKNAAKILADKMAFIYAPIIYSLMCVMTPVIWIVDKIAQGILFLMRIDMKARNTITEAELRTYVDVSHEDGVIESGEKVMINNVFDFSDSVAKDIMVPRIDMVCVEEKSKYEEVLEVFKKHMYTRIPVYRDEPDNVIGLINIKDFILVEDKKSFEVSDILRETYYTYEYKKTADLLMELRKTTFSLVFVLSEYGTCVGMVTLEDLLEEIVGEIRDEYDADEEEFIKKVEKNAYIIDGSRKIDDVNDELGLTLESKENDSIAGLVIEILDRMPEKGDEIVTEDGIRIRVQAIDKNRIKKVLLRIDDKEA